MNATSLRTRRSCTRNRATRCEELEEVVMNLSFENKVALVTGAGSGIGLATAKAFAEAGASVALAGQHEESVRCAGKELVAAGPNGHAIPSDVTDVRQVAQMGE